MRRATDIHLAGALVILLMTGLGAGSSVAEEAADPLAGLAALNDADLADLSGRQGISLSDQDLIAITERGEFRAGDDIETGAVSFGSSMQRMHGLNNQAINTGNGANVQAGMTVHINLY